VAYFLTGVSTEAAKTLLTLDATSPMLSDPAHPIIFITVTPPTRQISATHPSQQVI